jgi:hypothetical protein
MGVAVLGVLVGLEVGATEAFKAEVGVRGGTATGGTGGDGDEVT